MWEFADMAHLVRSEKTRFWVLRYRDLDSGQWRERSTKCDADDAKATRRAQRMAEEESRREAQVAPTEKGDFVAWVPEFIERHYTNKRSVKRYRLAWARIVEWQRLRRVRHPAAVRFEHVQDFLDWRTAQGASKNTARLEIKFFSSIMQEAMRRELTEKNPLALAKVPRKAAKVKKELTPEDFIAARAAFTERSGAPWMLTAFEICSHLGCRFSEAELGRDAVDFEKKMVTLVDSKRDDTDPRKRFCVPLPDTLATHLKAVFDKRDRTTPPLDKSGEHNRQFNKTLKAATGATSHSLRVSFITRCHRAGLSESQAMRLTNHSTRLVHLIYSRLNFADAQAAAALVPPPAGL
jgi:site-specific recombinase XerC